MSNQYLKVSQDAKAPELSLVSSISFSAFDKIHYAKFRDYSVK